MTCTEYQRWIDRYVVSKDPKERAIIKAIIYLEIYSTNYQFDEE